jgi:hypothetical protein
MATYAQNWNNVLSYIKIQLGVPTNMLEFPDDELIEHLQEHVLSLFSQYSAARGYSIIRGDNKIIGGPGSPQFMYRIPVPKDTYIIDILEALPTKEETIVDMVGGAIIDVGSAMNMVISNVYIDAVRSMQVRNTWEFLPPDILMFDKEVSACVVIYKTNHNMLNTIKPDVYHKAFKPLCLANTKLWVAAQRSKFENLSTPFGQINLNYDVLKTEGQTERDNAMQILESLPPEILIDVS